MVQTLISPFIRMFFMFSAIGWVSFGALHAQKKSNEPSPEVYVKTDYEPKLLNMKDLYADIAYPAEHFEAGKEGTVYFKILLDENGRYLKHLVLKSSDSLFTAAAEKNLKKVIFTPATVNQKPVKHWVTYPIHFKKEFAVKLEASNRINPKTGKPEGWWTYPSRSSVNSFDEVLLVHYTENDTLFKGKKYRGAMLLFEGTYMAPNDTLIRQGVFTFFTNEGKKREEGVYTEGERQGIWKTYYENGNIESSVTYERGKKEGESLHYFENGLMCRKAYYNGNMREGVLMKYAEKGTPILKIFYSKDIPEKVLKYNEEGAESEEDASPYIDRMPEFKGGYKAFGKFLEQNIQYPAEANLHGITGRVFVQFTVNKDGSISVPEVVKGIGYGCDEEAVRVIAMTNGMWEPGRIEGELIKVRFTQPISFIIEDWVVGPIIR